MAFESWDVETTTTITLANFKRETVPCEPRVVGRHGTSGRFGTHRQALEFTKGRLLFKGQYRTRLEIFEYLRETREWKGAQVERTNEGWRFRLGTAELFLRAA